MESRVYHTRTIGMYNKGYKRREIEMNIQKQYKKKLKLQKKIAKLLIKYHVIKSNMNTFYGDIRENYKDEIEEKLRKKSNFLKGKIKSEKDLFC